MTESFDTRVKIVTPENIAFDYRIAGPFHRLPAYLIDVVLRYAIVLVAILLLLLLVFLAGMAFGRIGMAWTGSPGVAFLLIMSFCLDWFYGGLFEAFWNGQTPGKRLLGLRVLSVDGQPITGWQAVLRNVLRTVDAMPLLIPQLAMVGIYTATFQIGLFSTMMTRRAQRLGDLACGTMVVVEDPPLRFGAMRVDSAEVVRLAEEIPPGFIPSSSLMLALSTYVLRRRNFPWQRRAEIARHVGEPLRLRFKLSEKTNHDLLLCALYHRTFFASDRSEEVGRAKAPSSVAPLEVPPIITPSTTS